MSSGTWSAGSTPSSGSELLERSDAELLAASRTGDNPAYSELWRRHQPAALALAKRLTGHPSDADDLVNEAFVKVLSALRNGNGPTSAMRPYLLTAVRRLNVDRALAGQRVQPTDDMSAHDPGQPFIDPALKGLENSLVATAYRQLPERWQMVLWHTEVEEMSPKDVAPLLGMSPNAVAALALRARAGLREAYLVAHVPRTSSPECEQMLPKLAAYVRGSAATRERAAVERHLPDCPECRAALAELQDVGGRMRAVIAPLILGSVASLYLADLAAVPALAAPMAAASGASGAAGASTTGSASTSGTAGAGGAASGASTAAAAGATGWVMAGAAGLVVMGVVAGTITLNNRAEESAARPSTAAQSQAAQGEAEAAEAAGTPQGGQPQQTPPAAQPATPSAVPTGASQVPSSGAGPGERMGTGRRNAQQSSAAVPTAQNSVPAGPPANTPARPSPGSTPGSRVPLPSEPFSGRPVNPTPIDRPVPPVDPDPVTPVPPVNPAPPATPEPPVQPQPPVEPEPVDPDPPVEPEPVDPEPPVDPPVDPPLEPPTEEPVPELPGVTVPGPISTGGTAPVVFDFPEYPYPTSLTVTVTGPIQIADNPACQVAADRLSATCVGPAGGGALELPLVGGEVAEETAAQLVATLTRPGAAGPVTLDTITMGLIVAPATLPGPGPINPNPGEGDPPADTLTGTVTTAPIAAGGQGELRIQTTSDEQNPTSLGLVLPDSLTLSPDGPCTLVAPNTADCGPAPAAGTLLVPVTAGQVPTDTMVEVVLELRRGGQITPVRGQVQILASTVAPGDPEPDLPPAVPAALWSGQGQLTVATTEAGNVRDLPGQVQRAELVWVTRTGLPVLLVAPDDTGYLVHPTRVTPAQGTRDHSAHADVTALVNAHGAGRWSMLGTIRRDWTLVVVSDDAAAPVGRVDLAVPDVSVPPGSSQELVPISEYPRRVTLVGLGGGQDTRVQVGPETVATDPFAGGSTTVQVPAGQALVLDSGSQPVHVSAVTVHTSAIV